MRFGLFLLFLCLGTPSDAGDGTQWIDGRLVPPFAQGAPAAIFGTLHHIGAGAAPRLVGASSPACGRIELHTHIHENGIMKMRAVDGFDIDANDALTLKPMGDHLMCFDPNIPNTSTTIDLTLTFTGNIAPLTLAVPIQKRPHPEPMGHAH